MGHPFVVVLGRALWDIARFRADRSLAEVSQGGQTWARHAGRTRRRYARHQGRFAHRVERADAIGGEGVTVLVTGGTGFIGSHVAARLAEGGQAVRLLVRDPAKLTRVPALIDTSSIDVIVGDVTDRESVERALDGCTAVVHAAAHVSLAERDAAQIEAVNVGGTRLVVGSAAERGLPAIYVSSVSIFTRERSPITIEAPLVDGGGPYTRSKVAAERVARELQDKAARIAIVYPSGVIGPGDPDVSASHLGLIGWVRTPPKTTTGSAIVDVRDVALAIERALDAPPERWMLGGTFLTYAELRAAIARVTGVRLPALPTPHRYCGSRAAPVTWSSASSRSIIRLPMNR